MFIFSPLNFRIFRQQFTALRGHFSALCDQPTAVTHRDQPTVQVYAQVFSHCLPHCKACSDAGCLARRSHVGLRHMPLPVPLLGLSFWVVCLLRLGVNFFPRGFSIFVGFKTANPLTLACPAGWCRCSRWWITSKQGLRACWAWSTRWVMQGLGLVGFLGFSQNGFG